MEILLFVIFSLVFTLIKSLAEKGKEVQPKGPKFEKLPMENRPKPSDRKRPSSMRPIVEDTVMTITPKKYANYQDMEIKVQQLDDETGNEIGGSVREISLEHDDIVKGIIMSEILESPRFKKPHKIS